MNCGFIARLGRAPFFTASALLFCAALLPAFSTRAVASRPLKLAVFDFELEDFSAGGALLPESAADLEQLKRVTEEVRSLMRETGRYELADVSGAASEEPVKGHWLRKCNGCEAMIAAKLGAEQSFAGTVTRISRTEYTVGFRIRDAKTGAILFDGQTDLRMGASYSWSRGAAWLVKNRLLASQEQR
ncbi:MAG TPA: DUF3280 domain-containing protein [Methylocella sp.]|nr:DUF3280 domain-containing protein [Methylocella sp.]